MIELPFYLIAALIVSALWGWGEAFRQRHKAQQKPRETPRIQLVSDHKHGLASVNHDGWYWSWRCECGKAGQIKSGQPTEERAIKSWLNHVEVHERLVLPTNELSHQACDARFVKVWDLFEQWRTACFCQSTNNDLILLNQEAKKLEKEPEKGVQLEA